MAGSLPGLAAGACPAPLGAGDRVQLGHGSGGRMSAALLAEHFLPHLGNPVLNALGDGAVVPAGTGEIAVSTDTFVVSPLEFPGGNIGSLAVHGTLNDVAMMGGRPRYLTAGFVLEEGLPFEVLDRVVAAMAASAAAAGVALVTGDTKVVERSKADGMFVNTTGIGLLEPGFRPAPDRARPGDAIIVSGPLGRHGMAIMAAREGIALEGGIESDTAALPPLVERLRQAAGAAVHVLRDPTRGGLASALNEVAAASGTGMEIEAAAVPVPPMVAAACEILGLDPFYVASEGVLVAVVDPGRAAAALAALRSEALGREAAIIGRVVGAHPGLVALRTEIGGSRILDMLPGDQLPRIC
jgi:hydrogenase expression/formation protein HypE